MKRKPEPKMCPHCKQDFGHGFALINHMRFCVPETAPVPPLRFAANKSSSQDKDEHFQSPTQHEDKHQQSSTQDDDVHLQSLTQDDDVHLQSSTQDQGQDLGPDLRQEQGLQHTQLPIVTRKVVRNLTPQLKAIVEFLESSEFGEGSSRTHSQHALDYTRSCVCAKTQLLPKDIKTCWIHVAKVVLLCLLMSHLLCLLMSHLLCDDIVLFIV